MISKKLIRKALAVTATVVLAGFAAISGLRFASSGASASTYSTPPAALGASLAKLYGITVTGPQPGDVPAITASQAQAVATTNFGWAGGGPSSAYLVRYTDEKSGTVGDGSGPVIPDRSSVRLLYMDRLVWLIVIPNASIPIIPPHGRSAGAQTYTATLCVFVDPKTGNYSQAVAIES